MNEVLIVGNLMGPVDTALLQELMRSHPEVAIACEPASPARDALREVMPVIPLHELTHPRDYGYAHSTHGATVEFPVSDCQSNYTPPPAPSRQRGNSRYDHGWLKDC